MKWFLGGVLTMALIAVAFAGVIDLWRLWALLIAICIPALLVQSDHP